MARSTILRAKNNTGSTIVAGKVVYISGFDDEDQVPTIALASNDDESKMPAVGIVREDIGDGDINVVKINGPINSLDTTGTSINDDVYVGQNGGIVFEEPSSVNEDLLTQQIGTVTVVDDYPDGQVQLFPLEIKRRIRHNDLVDVTEDQHHTQRHSETHRPNAVDEFIHAIQHEAGGGDVLNHGRLAGISEDHHTQYILVDGTRAFTGTVGGITPLLSSDLATKGYVDSVIPGEVWRNPVIDKDLTSPPAASDGDRYIVGPSATGLWSGHDDEIAVYNSGSWDFVVPDVGYATWVIDEDAIYAWNSATWLLTGGASVTGSGAIGQVTYWSGASSVTGSNNFYWDGANNRLGLATTSPSSRLHIEDGGTSDSSLLTITQDDDNLYAITITNDSASDNLRFTVGDTGIGYILSDSGEALHLGRDSGSGTTTDLTIDSSGQVGIGTASPSEQLEVSGAILIGNTGTTNDGTIRWTGSDFEGRKSGSWVSLTTSTTPPAGSDGQMQYNNGGAFGGASQFYYNDSNDRVGIRTSSPQANLEIEDGGTSAGQLLKVTADDDNLWGMVIGNDSFSTNDSDGLALRTTDAGISTVSANGSGASIDLSLNDSPAMQVHSDGNVTIGTLGNTRDFQVRRVGKADMHVGFYNNTTISSQRLRFSMDIGDGSIDGYTALYIEPWLANTSFTRSTDLGSLSLQGAVSFRKTGPSGHLLIENVAGDTILTTYDKIGIILNSQQHVGIKNLFPHEALTINGILSLQEQDNYDRTHDGYGSLWAKSDGKVYYTNDAGTEYDLTSAGDNYALKITEDQRWTDSSEQRQEIRDSLDGYALAITENQRWVDTSQQLQDLRDATDGYALTSVEDQRWADSSEQRQEIRDALDGYGSGSGTGDITGSGADGYVSYWTGEKTISGSESLYFDSVDGYLGIGTDMPNERLTVDGPISMAAIPSAPAEEDNFGKLYVTPAGTLIFLREDGEKFNLLSLVGDVDGGTFNDVYYNVGNIDAGGFV